MESQTKEMLGHLLDALIIDNQRSQALLVQAANDKAKLLELLQSLKIEFLEEDAPPVVAPPPNFEEPQTEQSQPPAPDARRPDLEQIKKITEAFQACIDMRVWRDKNVAWEWFKKFSGVESFKLLTLDRYEETLAELRRRYKAVPSERSQWEKISALLAKSVQIGVYKTPVESHQTFVAHYKKEPENMTYLEARNAIKDLTTMTETGANV